MANLPTMTPSDVLLTSSAAKGTDFRKGEKVISEEAMAIGLRQLKVSFLVALQAYEDVQRLGEIQDPRLAAAAFADIESMVTRLKKAGIDEVAYDGSHVNELLRRGNELIKGGVLDGA